MTTYSQRWDVACKAAILVVGALALVACGSSSDNASEASSSQAASGSSQSAGTSSAATTASCSAGCGTALVSLTDAAGDFDSYLVTVDAITLTRSDGTVVQVVPTTTQVNFAQLVNLSEIITAATIPNGRYTAASITLDYSGASIVVDNGTTGVTISPSNIIDGATNLPLVAPNTTQMTISLTLPSDAPLVVNQGTIANLALDFNLAASNTITPSDTAPTTVTVNPTLTASLVPDTTKQIDVRGALASVNSTAGTYVIGLRPFFNSSGTNGQITITTTSSTTYTINGTAYTGTSGLAELATLSAGTLTNTYGSYDSSTQTFTAISVLGGSSVAGSTLDSVTGTVVARNGNTITLAGGFVQPGINHGLTGFSPQVTVTVGSGTTVTEQGASGSFSIQDISVGQHAQFLGALSSTTESSSSSSSSGSSSSGSSSSSGAEVILPPSYTLDATGGSAILQPTSVVGVVTSAASDQVTLNLSSLDLRAPSVFNFAGTGSSSSTNASAAAYIVSVPTSVSISALTSGTPVSFSGFVTPFGAAPPDFAATSLVNYGNSHAQLQLLWSAPGVTAPFSTLTGSEILISQSVLTSATFDVLHLGAGVTVTPSTLSAGLQIDPDSSDSNPRFALVHRKSRTISTYSTFSDFATALSSEFNGTNAALEVVAEGPYNSATGALEADMMTVVTND